MDKVKLGLKENWKQFTLLVIINAFVGGMIGLERAILPKIAENDFGMVIKSAILSFIVVFGIAKAITNYYTGVLANKIGRKNLLTIGWLFAIPVPFILMYANSWSWVIFANVLLGINQGLAWSSTVVMKIDLVGEKNRGFAMGLNESAGYLAVGGVAFLTGWIASNYGIRPYPFYIGVVFSVLGLLSSWFLIKDTIHHVNKENITSSIPILKNIFWETTWKNRNLGSISQAGLVNNLNDGMVWGIFPLLLASKNFSISEIGVIVATYPIVWGLGQLFTGKFADVFEKKKLLFIGMVAQGLALFAMLWTVTFNHFVLVSVILGLGTALVYPTFLAGVAQFTHPQQRANSIGIFRLWRDLGYAIGAILTGLISDTWGLLPAITSIAILTIISSFIILIRMKPNETNCITKMETLKGINNNSVLLVDVRSEDEFKKEHIPEAIHLTKDNFSKKQFDLKKHATIITVCGKSGGRSEEAANELQSLGIDAKWLCGGTFGWLS
jgi:MFS family permease